MPVARVTQVTSVEMQGEQQRQAHGTHGDRDRADLTNPSRAAAGMLAPRSGQCPLHLSLPPTSRLPRTVRFDASADFGGGSTLAEVLPVPDVDALCSSSPLALVRL